MRYTKKPVTIEAFCFDGSEYPGWFKSALAYDAVTMCCPGPEEAGEPYVIIETLEGDMKADLGDYIIKGIKGELYPCKPDIFEETYTSEETQEDTSEPKDLWNLPQYPIQTVGRLNSVMRIDDEGPGGAYHHYAVTGSHDMIPLQEIKFQKGPRNEPGSINGVLDGDLLEIVRDRMVAFQNGPYACRENALILTHVEEALMWSAQRAHNRYQRGVLGTYQK